MFSRCPLLAQSGHLLLHRICPLSGVKQTCGGSPEMCANDSKRTLALLVSWVSFLTRRPVAKCYPCSQGHMRRRSFITLLGGAAAWPIAAHAQQGERVRRIGLLTGATADDPENQTNISVFLQALQQLGWTVGQNIKSTTAGPAALTTNIANTRPNWSRSRRTSSCPSAARH